MHESGHKTDLAWESSWTIAMLVVLTAELCSAYRSSYSVWPFARPNALLPRPDQ